jgi:hypothetical protein
MFDDSFGNWREWVDAGAKEFAIVTPIVRAQLFQHT